jgi:hypothetical protein
MGNLRCGQNNAGDYDAEDVCSTLEAIRHPNGAYRARASLLQEAAQTACDLTRRSMSLAAPGDREGAFSIGGRITT